MQIDRPRANRATSGSDARPVRARAVEHQYRGAHRLYEIVWGLVREDFLLKPG
jgi:hypothetical protein